MMYKDVWEETLSLNSFQVKYQLLEAKIKYLIAGRATGKSYIVGAEVDENVRMLPRGITSITQDTIGQALTKTLPSTFKLLEQLGYKKYDQKTKSGDYVVCQKPPDHFLLPYEKIMSYDNMITFSNGHALYLISQKTSGRGPNVDYNITDEALTIDKLKFDQESAATNRGNLEHFGDLSVKPIFKHHGSTFTSSMGYLPEHKWLTDPAKYYEEESGIQLFKIWNQIVKLQLDLIRAKLDGETATSVEIWKEVNRLKKQITPFVSKDGILFMLSNAFDNIINIGFSYIVKMYQTMDLMTFMIEILNYYIDKVTDCYYHIDDRHVYYKADNDDYIRGLADDTEFDWTKLENRHSLFDADCDPNQPIEITPDWGSKIALIEVAQERMFDFVSGLIQKTDNNINEFYVKPQDHTDTMINTLMDMFCHYYRHHKKKEVIYTVDTYGDIRLASSRKTYNQLAIARLERNKWKVTQRKHPGKEPPHNEKYLLWQSILAETNPFLPKKRFNGTRCKYTLISMNNTSVFQKPNGLFEKDKKSEARESVLPEEATHFGDAVDKRIWTKYGYALRQNRSFVAPRI